MFDRVCICTVTLNKQRKGNVTWFKSLVFVIMMWSQRPNLCGSSDTPHFLYLRACGRKIHHYQGLTVYHCALLTVLPLAVGRDGEAHAVDGGEVPPCHSSPSSVVVFVFPDVLRAWRVTAAHHGDQSPCLPAEIRARRRNCIILKVRSFQKVSSQNITSANFNRTSVTPPRVPVMQEHKKASKQPKNQELTLGM